PLAHRLGMWDIKWQLEDLAFRYLQPEEYHRVSRLLATRRQEREAYIEQVAKTLRRAFIENGIKAEVYGRPKHIFSVAQKVQKYAEQGKEFSEIYDLYAIRVLTETKADCYNTLGVVHSLWRPIPGQFNDFVANPKQNLYQSLHTTVMCEGGIPLEVQIRTHEMHQLAEYGVAAHWRYKEGKPRDLRFEEKMTWLRQLLEWQREVSGAEEFLESVKTDLFGDQVFVYTPKGDIKELPAGATPLDFAFHVHTELGFRCIGAKVNGRLVSLDYQLQNGDTVEIMTSKLARGPSLDWLNLDLGYLRTASALRRVRQWFRRQERGDSVERGRDLLQRELKRLAMDTAETEIAKLLKYDSVEELLAAIGNGTISAEQLAARLLPQAETPAAPSLQELPPSSPLTGIQVLGTGDLLTRTARCCSPLPGDEILGFITRNQGVTIHRKDCGNIAHEDEPERLVQVSWGPAQQLYPVRVRIVAWDRVGLLRDITTLVSSDKVNIASMVTTEESDGTAIITLTLYTTGIGQLTRLFAKLEGVKGVIGVTRADVAASSPAQPAPKHRRG
ncbi:MAG: bifunctional (p)ppGpp synthetase/guanosine-3',5'-bis(diphosphate) 3'-pyrophosphohydrolase, partial [Chloroflexi bacterium]|nr:bifunctional (p)ppGpp synthetase/guanosine-3',5'-bis(diphosphate) 3'-pyrophosphohydrolase [Chloroflexota bacterium]